MTSPLNPYATPNINRAGGTWWQWFRGLFSNSNDRHVVRYENFLAGEVVMIEGIAFFIDPNNSRQLFAASGSKDVGKERMNQILAEAQRLQIQLWEMFPEGMSELQGRDLVIKVVEYYDECKSKAGKCR